MDRDTLQCTPPCCLPSSEGERVRLSQKTPWGILAAFSGLHEPTVRVPIACMAAAMERRESYVQPAVLTADDIISKKKKKKTESDLSSSPTRGQRALRRPVAAACRCAVRARRKADRSIVPMHRLASIADR